MKTLTKDIALSLSCRQIIYHKTLKNCDNTPLRAFVNGQCKTWKTRPNEFCLPVKHGLRDYFYITQDNCDKWEVTN